MTRPADPRRSPGLCASCGRAFLAAATSGVGAQPQLCCPRCGGTAHLLPGTYYPESGSVLFQALEEQVHAAALSRAEATELTIQLENAVARPEGAHERVRQVLYKMRCLRDSCESVPSSLIELHSFVGLLLSLLVSSVRPSVRPASPALGSGPSIHDAATAQPMTDELPLSERAPLKQAQ